MLQTTKVASMSEMRKPFEPTGILLTRRLQSTVDQRTLGVCIRHRKHRVKSTGFDRSQKSIDLAFCVTQISRRGVIGYKSSRTFKTEPQLSLDLLLGKQ